MRPLPALCFGSMLPALLCAQQGIFVDTPPKKPATQSTPGALGQLEALTGQKVNRNKVGTSFTVRKPAPAPKKAAPSRSTANQQAAALVGGLLGNLLAQALEPSGPSGPDPAELARIEAERQEALRREQAELQAWAQAYASNMNALVDHQRKQRTAQNGESLEGLRASLSDGWDSAGPGAAGTSTNSLASALADPAPVVDLRGSRTFTPSLLREANGVKRTTPVSADDLLKRREEAQARLRAMMAENQDLRVLGQRFYELEAELTRLKGLARGLGSEGRSIQREMDYWGWRIEQATQACMERGTSLLTGTLLPGGVNAGMKRLQKTPKLWGQTMQSLSDLNDFTEFSTTLTDRYDAAGQALDWAKAKHSLMQNVDFIATNLQHVSGKLSPVSLHWEVGKTLVGTSVDLAAEVDGWGAILERQGDISLVLQKQGALKGRLEAVVKDLQASRSQLAAQLGVRPEDLIPPGARKGLGSNVPPL